MKLILLILFFTISICSFSQTQSELNFDAYTDYKETDVELNYVYQEILSEYKSDSVFIDRLRKTQRIWISYRDAELETKFPGKNKRFTYGSIYPLCAYRFLKDLTEERIEKLKIWLIGIEEGNACNGSVKMI